MCVRVCAYMYNIYVYLCLRLINYVVAIINITPLKVWKNSTIGHICKLYCLMLIITRK